MLEINVNFPLLNFISSSSSYECMWNEIVPADDVTR